MRGPTRSTSHSLAQALSTTYSRASVRRRATASSRMEGTRCFCSASDRISLPAGKDSEGSCCVTDLCSLPDARKQHHTSLSPAWTLGSGSPSQRVPLVGVLVCLARQVKRLHGTLQVAHVALQGHTLGLVEALRN